MDRNGLGLPLPCVAGENIRYLDYGAREIQGKKTLSPNRSNATYIFDEPEALKIYLGQNFFVVVKD